MKRFLLIPFASLFVCEMAAAQKMHKTSVAVDACMRAAVLAIDDGKLPETAVIKAVLSRGSCHQEFEAMADATDDETKRKSFRNSRDAVLHGRASRALLQIRSESK